MIKKKKNLIIILIIFVLEIFILLNPNVLITYSKDALSLFTNKLFISLFPFFILNKILIDYNLPYYISKLKSNSITSSIVILSLLSGMPSNAEYIKDYLDSKIISLEEAKKLLIVTYFPSPVFVITVVGYLGFNSIFIGSILLLIVYLSNFLLWIFIRNKKKLKNNNSYIKTNVNFMISFKKAIISSLNSLMIILGNIIIFSILIGLLNKYFSLNIYLESLLTSLLELSNGIKKISAINTNFNIKFSLCLFALIFSGFSIHSQVSSILSKYNINFFKIILYRLIAAVFISCFSYMILCFLNH